MRLWEKIILLVWITIVAASVGYTAVSQEVLINIQSGSGTSITPLRVQGGADNATNATNKIAVLGARANAAAPTWTENHMVPLSVDNSGSLRTSTTFTPSGTQDVNLTKVNGNAALAGNGVTGTGSPRVTVASDNTPFTVNKSTVGSNFYSIAKANLTTASVNLAFGFTSRKVVISTPSTNTDNVCLSFTGGTAVCPAANTAGNKLIKPGQLYFFDDIAITSVSVIAASGTQEVDVDAMN